MNKKVKCMCHLGDRNSDKSSKAAKVLFHIFFSALKFI